ncbi:MAG: hypothetical protein WCY15_06175 [Phenylobacterium sp.]|jgi:hypothetical protein|uniref:hypothetical protein n=1 Tax=Phenylobacterium sp. TaxID=1871053 RepID=UPI002A317329|nr:hypothetical protein [Phenylobacterium sp.]MDD3836676.1 hypothetical protein [Phenylobacterium sp.]MDX9996840.1 hypothetical protein [Phenylobacterium sp.]
MTLNLETGALAASGEELAHRAALQWLEPEEESASLSLFQQINERRAAVENPEALRILRSL